MFGPLEFLVLDNIGAGKMSGHDETEHVRDTGPSYAGVKLKDFNIIWNAAIEAAAKCFNDNGEGAVHDVAAEIRKLKK